MKKIYCDTCAHAGQKKEAFKRMTVTSPTSGETAKTKKFNIMDRDDNGFRSIDAEPYQSFHGIDAEPYQSFRSIDAEPYMMKKIYCNSCLGTGEKKEAIKRINLPNGEQHSFCEDCYLDLLIEMNKKADKMLGQVRLYCLRCGHYWTPREKNAPKKCPACNSPYYNKKRQQR